MKKMTKTTYFRNTISKYIKNNSKEYILSVLIFTIGIFIGVMFINNVTEEQETTIVTYISDFLEKFKNIENIDNKNLLISSMKNNIILTFSIWIAGTTIIGLPVVLGIILFRGFCLGYTISSITLAIGTGKSIIFCLLTLLLQNILFIPALLTMGVSSIKLYKAIINDRRKENIKIGIASHTIISLIMLGILILSSFIESEISVNLLKTCIKLIKI